jgi:sigma-E factor negative regulatory protein RseA
VSHEQLDSQLSAMYDGELPAAECELLSRRLAREEALRARWSRYAMIGAVMRSEPVAAVSGDFARRVSSVIAADARRFSLRRLAPNWWMPASGVALAAGVAGIAILMLRNGLPVQAPVVAAVRPAAVAPAIASQPLQTVRQDNGFALAAPVSREPASYVVPPRSSGSDVDVPASLASFVVAHSEYSPPLVRRQLLSAWIGNDLVQTTPNSSVLFNDAGAAPPANGTN